MDTKTSKSLPEYDSQLRKITLFLILNTDVKFKYDLVNDYTINHLLNAMTVLPKCLLHECIWGLSLERYFCECIAYSPNWFAYQFIENIVDSLKFADPYETLDHVDQLVCAIYTNIARSGFRQMDIVDQKIIFNKMFDVITDLLRHFYSPDAEKFDNWSKNKYRKYMGFVLKHNLDMISHCFELFQRRPILKSDPTQYDIYTLMREREPLIDDHRIDYTATVREILHKINITLLNALQYNVMQVDCMAFLYWVEIDIDDDFTLQRVVGEAAYNVQQTINSNECFEHDVSNQLKAISIKPRTIEEIITQSTIGELIEKLEKLVDANDPNIDLWLNAFIDRGELVLGNTECLEALELHIASFKSDLVKRLISFALNCDIENGCEVEEKLIEICLSSFDHISTDDIYQLIQYSIDEQKQHFRCFQLENFGQNLIEVFNKITFAANPNTYLKLLFQNPQLFYDKLFNESLSTEMQMQHMIKILQATAIIFKNYVKNQLKYLIESNGSLNDSSQSLQLLPVLLSQIFFINLIEPSEFIVNILYKQYLIDAMKNSNFDRIHLIITTLTLIADNYKFDGICPPLLVMSAQILELCRWNLLKFTDQLLSIVVKTIDFINTIMKGFLPTASENEKSWIIAKTSTYTSLTRYYFQKLSLTKEQTPVNFDRFLWPTDKDPDDRQHSIKFLCEHLVRCTNKEINWLAKQQTLFTCFWNAFELIINIVSRSKQTNEINCLKHCCNAFMTIIDVSQMFIVIVIDMIFRFHYWNFYDANNEIFY